MKIQYRIAAIVAVATPLLTAEAQAAEIKVLASTAVKTTLEELAPQFEKATGSKVDVTFSPASVLKEKIDQGTAFDVAILTTPIIDGLASSGKIETTRTAIAHSGIGIAIKKGAAKPDIATSEAFKQALLKASSVGYTAGGATGAYLKTLFEKLGIADALKPKLKLLQGGVGEAVTNGEIEIGMTQISAGVSAASKEVDAAKAFVKFLAGPPALAVIKAKGMEPG